MVGKMRSRIHFPQSGVRNREDCACLYQSGDFYLTDTTAAHFNLCNKKVSKKKNKTKKTTKNKKQTNKTKQKQKPTKIHCIHEFIEQKTCCASNKTVVGTRWKGDLNKTIKTFSPFYIHKRQGW